MDISIRSIDKIIQEIQQITTDIDPEDVNIIPGGYYVHFCSPITIDQALTVAKIPEVKTLSFIVDKYTSSLGNFLFEILEYVDEMWYYGPWPSFAHYIDFYEGLGKIVSNIKELRVNNLLYTMDPETYPKLFKVFPSLRKLQYFLSGDSSPNEFDIVTLTSDDITKLTPSTIQLDPYGH